MKRPARRIATPKGKGHAAQPLTFGVKTSCRWNRHGCYCAAYSSIALIARLAGTRSGKVELRSMIRPRLKAPAVDRTMMRAKCGGPAS